MIDLLCGKLIHRDTVEITMSDNQASTAGGLALRQSNNNGGGGTGWSNDQSNDDVVWGGGQSNNNGGGSSWDNDQSNNNGGGSSSWRKNKSTKPDLTPLLKDLPHDEFRKYVQLSLHLDWRARK